MKMYTRSVLLALSFLGVTTANLALAQPNATQNSANDCSGTVVYRFQHLDPNTHEQISCIAPNGTVAEFFNQAEMIKGFDSHGHLSIAAEKLNQYYLDAYHDWKYPGMHGTLCSSTLGVVCYEGKRAPGETKDRKLIPGDYGVRR